MHYWLKGGGRSCVRHGLIKRWVVYDILHLTEAIMTTNWVYLEAIRLIAYDACNE